MPCKYKSVGCIAIVLGFFHLIITGCDKIDFEQTVKDIDGNVYHTVTIGSQVWMVENLKVTRFTNGDKIDQVTGIKSSNGWPTPQYCSYNNDSAGSKVYGILYNYRVIHYSDLSHREIAPKGWHVPSDEEWKILIEYLGGENVAGGKLKETGTRHWKSPNSGATNESGFTALPGGECTNLNAFISKNQGLSGSWWSSYNQWGAFYYSLNASASAITYNTDAAFETDFKSIRCIKD